MLGWAVLPIAWCRVLSPNDIEWLAPVTEKLNLLPSSPKDTFVVRLATPEFCNALLTSSVINLPNSWIVWNWKTEYSSELTYQKEVTYKEDFTSVEQLTDRITNSINGGVVPGGFSAEFLENDFGLEEGEGISFNDITVYDPVTNSAIATLQIGPFTYTETVNPTIRNQFHTIQELGRLITDEVNNALQNSGDSCTYKITTCSINCSL